MNEGTHTISLAGGTLFDVEGTALTDYAGTFVLDLTAPQVIDSLRAREDEGGYVALDKRPKFALGEKVRVLASVFAENFGLFDGMADRERIAILLDLLGRKVRVSIEPDLVTAA